MSSSPDHDRKIERAVHQALRELPARRAPRTLEQRVLAEIERRAALPWWRKSFAHWPVAARAAFLAGCIGAVILVLMGGGWVMSGFDPARFHSAFAQPIAWMETGVAVVHAITGFFEIVVRNLPPFWVQGGVAFLVTMYVALFGLGAAAYKTLHAPR